MKRLPAASAVSAGFLSLGLAPMISTPAAAAGPSFADGAIHCSDGKTIAWSAGRSPPSEGEQRFECALNPHTAEAATPSSDASAPA